MSVFRLIEAEAVFIGVRCESKARLLDLLATRAAQLLGLDAREILDTLSERERLGSTGVGHGVAIPHGKLKGLQKLFGLFMRLDTPVEYDALDGEPVDLIFLLLAPERSGAEHLKALARVARLMREAGVAEKLRRLRDTSAIHSVLVNTQ